MRRAIPLIWTILVSLWSTTVHASFDEFADSRAPRNIEIEARDLTLVIKGEVELELHDLEGDGGPEHDSPTDTRTIGTRSPFVEIDGFWLAFRIAYSRDLSINTALDFGQRDARAGSVWANWQLDGPRWLTGHVELGYHTPIIAIDRRTESYPLLATSYWRQPEFHLAYEGIAQVGSHLSVELGTSVAMMRPLVFATLQESTTQPSTIGILSYGAARPFSGNGPVAGGRLRLASHGGFVEGFGFVGALSAEYGTRTLEQLYNYRDLPGYSGEAGTNETFHWGGGRVGYDGFGAHALLEGITSREGLLERRGLTAQLSYRLSLRDPRRLFHTIEPLVRSSSVRIRHATTVQSSGRALRSTAPVYAGAWDYDVRTLALIAEVYRDLVRLRAEYFFINEHNGVPGLAIDDAPVKNNELLVQAELRF